MTTTVKAGTNRPAAKARTRKAAQRTPLPGDDTSAEFTALNAIPLTEQTAAQRRRIRTLANRPENTGERPDTGSAKAPAATPRPPRKLPNLEGMAEEAPSGSRRKADALRAVLRPFGWRVTTEATPGDRVTLTAKRRKETLVIVWTSGVFEYDASSHTDASGTRKVRNVSAARQLCAVAL